VVGLEEGGSKNMKLKDYLARRRVHKKTFCDDLGISESTLYKYINQEREPSLQVAIWIESYSEGKVPIKDLIRGGFKPLKLKSIKSPDERHKRRVIPQDSPFKMQEELEEELEGLL
jgi:transcriptional regulator with XRE-family HTH domain